MTDFKTHIIRKMLESMVDCPEYECKKTFLFVYLTDAFSAQTAPIGNCICLIDITPHPDAHAQAHGRKE
jgi:hypothetical protein